MATKKPTAVALEIDAVKVGRVEVALLGTTPIVLNAMSAKARQQLLVPPPKKNAAARASTMKHDPYAEYRRAPYRITDPAAPTLLAVLSSSVKAAMATAALDLPGASRAQMGRLLHVESERLPLFGTPKLFMSVVRSADINRTPDIRTRAIVPEWAVVASIRFVTPLLTSASVGNLLVAAGMTAGLGDWRAEKGKGDYGSFVVVNLDDPRLLDLMGQGRAAQERAMLEPECYDEETAELLEWYEGEVLRRTGAAVDRTDGVVFEDDEIEEAEVAV